MDVRQGCRGRGIDGLERRGGGRGLELAVVVGEAWRVGEGHGDGLVMGELGQKERRCLLISSLRQTEDGYGRGN